MVCHLRSPFGLQWLFIFSLVVDDEVFNAMICEFALLLPCFKCAQLLGNSSS